jgi:hypothetical protein
MQGEGTYCTLRHTKARGHIVNVCGTCALPWLFAEALSTQLGRAQPCAREGRVAWWLPRLRASEAGSSRRLHRPHCRPAQGRAGPMEYSVTVSARRPQSSTRPRSGHAGLLHRWHGTQCGCYPRIRQELWFHHVRAVIPERSDDLWKHGSADTCPCDHAEAFGRAERFASSGAGDASISESLRSRR